VGSIVGVGVGASGVGVGEIWEVGGVREDLGWKRDLPRKKPPKTPATANKTKVAIRGGGNLGVGKRAEEVISGFGGRLVWEGVEMFGCSILTF